MNVGQNMYYVDKNGRVKQEKIFWENAIIYWSIIVGCVAPTSAAILPHIDFISEIGGNNFQSYWGIFVFEFLSVAALFCIAALLGFFTIYALTFVFSLVSTILLGGFFAVKKIPNELSLDIQQILDAVSYTHLTLPTTPYV